MLSIKTRMRGYQDLNTIDRMDLVQYCIGQVTGISNLLFSASSINGDWLLNAGAIVDYILENDYEIPINSMREIIENFNKVKVSRYKLDAICELMYEHGDFLYDAMKLQRLMLDKFINNIVLSIDFRKEGIMEDMIGPYMQLIMMIIISVYDVSDIWDGNPIHSIMSQIDWNHPESAKIGIVEQMLAMLGRCFVYIDGEIFPDGKYMEIIKKAGKIFKYDFIDSILVYKDGTPIVRNETDCDDTESASKQIVVD